MNDDIVAGKWKEMRGQVREWWGKLTDDELEQAAGKSEQMIGLIQQKYGYTREKATEEYNGRMKSVKHDAHKDGLTMNDDVLAGKWKQMRGQVKEWWGKLTDDELDQAAGRSEQMVGLIQEKYGYTRERAQDEYNSRRKAVEAYKDSMGD